MKNLLLIMMLAIGLSANWEYRDNIDRMSGETTKRASLDSDNKTFLRYPYDSAKSTIRLIENKEIGTILGISISDGLMGEVKDYGKLRVKFDDELAMSISGKYTKNSFLINDNATRDTFIEKLKNAKKVLIEIHIYNNGNSIFEFSPYGLEWSNEQNNIQNTK